MSPLRMQLDRIRQGAWLVALVAVAAVVLTVWSTAAAGTVYTGRAALSVGSQYRAPEQDAVLSSGYADLFNEPSYQEKLRGDLHVPAGVVLSARTAAASPIIYIEAAARDAGAAQAAASAVAAAFLVDVNKSLQTDQDNKVATLNTQIDAQRKLLETARPGSQDATLASTAISALQGRIGDVQGNTTNQLQELQPSAGVAAKSPTTTMNAALALVGGLILGALAAIGLALARGRLSTVAEITDALDLPVLVEVPAGKSLAAERDRTQQLKRLANIVAPATAQRPVVVAVVAPRRSGGVAVVAESIARNRAEQGERSVLVRTNLGAWPDDDAEACGVTDVLDDPRGLRIESLLLPGATPSMWVLPPGTSDADPYGLFSESRFAALIREVGGVASFIVIEVPPMLEAAEAQAICTAADHLVLVVDAGVTRASDAREAVTTAAQVSAVRFGVALLAKGSLNTEVSPAEKRADPASDPEQAAETEQVGSSDSTHTTMLEVVHSAVQDSDAQDRDVQSSPSPRPRSSRPAPSASAERTASR